MSEQGTRLDRSDLGRRKFGNADDGTEAAHILSFEVFNDILAGAAGRPFSEDTRDEYVRALNADENVRIKSAAGNRNAGNAEPYRNDRELDRQIIENRVTTRAAYDRMQRQWAFIANNRTISDAKKELARAYFRERESKYGVAVRANAAYSSS